MTEERRIIVELATRTRSMPNKAAWGAITEELDTLGYRGEERKELRGQVWTARRLQRRLLSQRQQPAGQSIGQLTTVVPVGVAEAEQVGDVGAAEGGGVWRWWGGRWRLLEPGDRRLKHQDPALQSIPL